MSKKIFDDLDKLFDEIEKEAMDVLSRDVSNIVKEAMSNAIKEITYAKYTPSQYVRRMDNGGLSDVRNMEVTRLNKNSISIRNVTTGNSNYPKSTGNLIDEIIVTGEGYTWDRSEIYKMQPFPRDFYEDTAEELRNTNEHEYAMYKGLRKRGLNVSVKN